MARIGWRVVQLEGRLPRLSGAWWSAHWRRCRRSSVIACCAGPRQREKPPAESSGSGRCAGAGPGSSGGSSWVGAGGSAGPAAAEPEAIRDPPLVGAAAPRSGAPGLRRVGKPQDRRLQLPDALLGAIRQSACVALDVPVAQRIRLLRDEYRHYERHPERLCAQLDCLAALHGPRRRRALEGHGGETTAGTRWSPACSRSTTTRCTAARFSPTIFARAKRCAFRSPAPTPRSSNGPRASWRSAINRGPLYSCSSLAAAIGAPRTTSRRTAAATPARR